MTNDDRSNDDRTADGRTPSWGQPQGDTPRYGERITPASAPQYGEQQAEQPRYGEQPGQQQYGQQPQWGQPQQQYGQQPQQYGQPQYGVAPASAGTPAWKSHDEPRPKKSTVGRVAAVLAVSALVIGVITGFLFGSAIAQSGVFRELMQNGGGTPDASQFSGMENDPAFAASGLMFLFGTIVGLWALVQGIVAIATRRGRGAGIFAVIVAVVAVIAVFVVYGIVAAASLSGAGS